MMKSGRTVLKRYGTYRQWQGTLRVLKAQKEGQDDRISDKQE